MIPVIDEKSPSVVAKTFELNEMKWNITFSKINKNLQQFHVTSKNKTQGNLQTDIISMIKRKKQAKLEEKSLTDKSICSSWR